MSIDPNAYTSSTAGTIKLGTKSLTGSDAIDVLTGTASEVAQPLYYPQNTKSQQSDYAATDQMSNVGAALFDSSTSYQSFFDKYKNVAGGVAPLDPNDEGFLASVYYTPPEPPPDDTPPPPPAALIPPEIPSHDSGVDDPFSGNFQDPFAVDDPTVTADQSQAVPGTGGPDFFSRDDISEGQARAGMQPGSKTFSEVLAGMGKGLQSLVTTFSTPGIIADLLGDNKGGPAKPGYVPGRSRATGQPAGYQSQNFNTQGRSGMLGNTSGSSQASPPDPGGMGDDPGGGGPDAAPGPDISDMDPGLFASGGTVKAKTKKVPSFMDSK